MSGDGVIYIVAVKTSAPVMFKASVGCLVLLSTVKKPMPTKRIVSHRVFKELKKLDLDVNFSAQ
jgi:hypothetical protein